MFTSGSSRLPSHSAPACAAMAEVIEARSSSGVLGKCQWRLARLPRLLRGVPARDRDLRPALQRGRIRRVPVGLVARVTLLGVGAEDLAEFIGGDTVLVAVGSDDTRRAGAIRRRPLPLNLSHGQAADLGWLSLVGRSLDGRGRWSATESEPFRRGAAGRCVTAGRCAPGGCARRATRRRGISRSRRRSGRGRRLAGRGGR